MRPTSPSAHITSLSGSLTTSGAEFFVKIDLVIRLNNRPVINNPDFSVIGIFQLSGTGLFCPLFFIDMNKSLQWNNILSRG